jgi:hypothetical protein
VAVDRYPSIEDDSLAGAARSHSGLREKFLKSFSQG